MADAPRLPKVGEFVRGYGTLTAIETWDFGGLESSVTGAVDEAKTVSAARGITAGSSLEVVVVRKTEHARWFPSGKPGFYDATFVDFNIGSRQSLPPDTDKVVWSSRRDLPSPEVAK